MPEIDMTRRSLQIVSKIFVQTGAVVLLFQLACAAPAFALTESGLNNLSNQVSQQCPKGPNNCGCLTTLQAGTLVNGRLTGSITKEACPAPQGDIYYGDCYCKTGDTSSGPFQDTMDYNSCQAQCQAKGATIDTTQGIGHNKPTATQTGGSPAQTQFVNALCFTLEQCASPDYGGTASAWVADSMCPTGQGKCMAPAPAITLSSPVLGVTSITGLPQYVTLMFKYLLSIVVLTAAVMFIYGGFKYIVGSSSGDIGSAKETMVNAAIGLFLSFAAVTLLNTFNPATTNYSQLAVWMVNKQEFSNLIWCSDYKQAGNTPLLFADAGTPSGSTQYSAAQFTVTPALTACGKNYYIQNFNGQTCQGQSCAPDTGKVCVQCSTPGACPTGSTTGAACVPAVAAGTITFSDSRQPKALYLLGVCNNAVNAATASAAASAIPGFIQMNLVGSSGSNGTAAYRYAGSSSALQQLTNGCASQGGFAGAVFGVIYNDTGTSIASGAAKGAAIGAVVGVGVGAVPGAIIGGAAGAVTVNDAAIVAKKDCSGGTTIYSGYADGTATSFDTTDMKTAFYCGTKMSPGKGANANGSGAFTPDAFFSQADLQQAFSGQGQAIQCNFSLNNQNAPSDPGTNLEGGCK
ncbi:MAG: pilin [Patescibacteria group bacterium]